MLFRGLTVHPKVSHMSPYFQMPKYRLWDWNEHKQPRPCVLLMYVIILRLRLTKFWPFCRNWSILKFELTNWNNVKFSTTRMAHFWTNYFSTLWKIELAVIFQKYEIIRSEIVNKIRGRKFILVEFPIKLLFLSFLRIFLITIVNS